MAHGSSFFHASQTDLGFITDLRMNDLVSFVGYQAAVANLQPLESSVIHDLSVNPRCLFRISFGSKGLSFRVSK